MELLDFPIRLNHIPDSVYIHIFGDIHRAAAGCDVLQLHSDINQLKKANKRKDEIHRWIGLGDWMNAIGGKDKRHDAAAVAVPFRQYSGRHLFGAEQSALASDFRPIADLGVGIMAGNHEASIARLHEIDHAQVIAERLNLPYLGYSALIRFRLIYKGSGAKEQTYSVICYCHHGYGAARTKGAKVNKLHSLRDVAQADVYVIGHDHEIVDFPEVQLSVNRKGALRLQEKHRLFINGGTYLKAYPVDPVVQKAGRYNKGHDVITDYAEVKAYRPSVIGHNGWCMQVGHRRHDAPMEVRLKRVDFRR